MNSTQAYACLNLEPDLRNYEAAGSALQYLLPGRPIALMTNDPRKETFIRAEGVNIVKRLPLIDVCANLECWQRSETGPDQRLESDPPPSGLTTVEV
jgi:GTP cyclohydrolase II